MKGSTREILGQAASVESSLMKTTFLSYYISMYNTVNERTGFPNSSVTVDEIYDFLQDLKHEAGESIPEIKKEDIKFSFHILHLLGICKAI